MGPESHDNHGHAWGTWVQLATLHELEATLHELEATWRGPEVTWRGLEVTWNVLAVPGNSVVAVDYILLRHHHILLDLEAIQIHRVLPYLLWVHRILRYLWARLEGSVNSWVGAGIEL